MRNFLALILCATFTLYSGQAQILDKIKKVKDDIAANTIDKLSSDPVTTSFKDVDKTKHFENTYGDNAVFKSLFEQPFQPENGFTLSPGFYEGKFQSFCIKAGTYMPTQGRGRFYAPIKGPKADIISYIVKTYQERSDLTHREVQLLLWAIIAKTDFAKMKGPVKATALKMLSTKQIARLSKGAIDKLTRNELKKVANQSDAVRAVLEAENNLRQKYYSGARTYQEYEQIAMRAGVEPIVPGWEAGRWTQHPDGYFIRYYPQGYRETTTQLYIPENAGTVRFNPSTDIAVPPNRGQRLLQTSLPSTNPTTNTGGYTQSSGDEFCEPVFNAVADKAIREHMIAQNIPGLAVAIFQNGKMVHLKAYGNSDIYKETPITVSTKMKWASISKSVTGVAAAQLQEHGVQSFFIGNNITDYVENWGDVDFTDTTGTKSGIDRRPRVITVAQLLNNTSGIHQYGTGTDDLPYALVTMPPDDTAAVAFTHNPSLYGKKDTRPGRKFKAKEAVDVFNQSVLNAQPGAQYVYSSYGFVLAGAAVDKVTPNGYAEWVQREIIDKSGLRSMGICEEKRPGHKITEDGMLTAYKSGTLESTLPAGGYESNICDLAKYALALSSGEYFDNASNSQILWNNSVSSITNSGFNYSYGLNNFGSGTDLRVWHGGHGGNARSFMYFFPSDNTGIVILAPAVYSDLPEMTSYIFQEMNIRPHIFNGRTDSPMDWCRNSMVDGEDAFHAVWRRTNRDVLVRTGIEKSIFFKEMKRLKNELKNLKNADYNVVDIETFKNNGKRYWDAVIKEGVPETRLVSDIKLSDLKKEIIAMKADGYILSDVESYVMGKSGRRWGAVFSKVNRYNESYFKMSSQEFIDKHQEMSSRGFALVDMEGYRAGKEFHWTGVWTADRRTILEIDKNTDDLFIELQAKRNQGYRLIDIEYYFDNNKKWKIALLWEESSDDEFITGEVADLNGDGDDDGRADDLHIHKFCEHMSNHQLLSSLGYELIDWERIPIEIFD